MKRPRLRKTRPQTVDLALFLIVTGLVTVLFSAAFRNRGNPTPLALVVGGVGFLIGLGLAIGRLREAARWQEPIKNLARNLDAFNAQPDEPWELPAAPELTELTRSIKDLQGRYLSLRQRLDLGKDDESSVVFDIDEPALIDARMTRSGSFEPPTIERSTLASAEVSTLEMIDRLDPRTLRWLTSTPAEQEFLGWTIDELKKKSFLEIVQDDDRRLAKQELRAVLERGEGHGLIYRITTAKGETKAVELNIGVRYGPDRKVLHLRCHLTDVTAKLRDESELKRRTQELTQANDDLRRINRELEQLKDRYSDLYENAPAMYFTVDRRGKFLECNNTLIETLGYSKRYLIGRTVLGLLPASRTPSDSDRLLLPDQAASIEFETEWARSDGSTIAVWVTGTATFGSEGKIRQVRCVARDVTARRILEAELQVKNERLALANAELSTRNKELDEFTYVVSHDLQEPLRTLIAFSDFLMRDQGDKLDDAGKDYVRYLVDASRRLRSLIQDLLALSRAGKVTADFVTVNLDEIIEVVKADLSELIRSKNAEIQAEFPLPEAWGDRDRIGQLLANLVANGLKYNQSTNPKVEIASKLDDDGRFLTLSIKDNGIGIDPKFHARIFQLFRRLHTREEYEGTGAGLAICQKIVQAHGGRIWVESEPGLGSTFQVRLPRAVAGPSPSQPEIPHGP
jgi:PAS domain S-box-containing protein